MDLDPRISPEGRAWLEEMIRRGGLVAGPAVPADFKEGWGIACFVGKRLMAHHWTADRSHAAMVEQGGYLLLSTCGVQSYATRRAPLFGCGNAPMCTNCDRKMLAQMKRRGYGALRY